MRVAPSQYASHHLDEKQFLGSRISTFATDWEREHPIPIDSQVFWNTFLMLKVANKITK